MRALYLAAPLVISAVALSSCALLDSAAERVGDGITRYCKEPLKARELLREQINEHAAPNRITIRCAGDPA